MSSDRGTQMLSIPHGGAEASGDYQASIHNNDDQHSTTAVDIVVYFAENRGLHLKVVDGQNATASELFEMVMEEQEYPEEARELFSLWLVSDLLELQLKPTHVPFKLVCYWEELLDRYSSASLFERQRDEPVIMFRRNVFCSCEVERAILTGANMLEMLRLLYSEAKKNVLVGRYPLSRDDCDKLGGIQAVITEKEANEADGANEPISHNLETFRLKSMEYLPAHFCKRRWLIGTRENPEYRLQQSYDQQREDCDAIGALYTLYHKYLSVCQEKPYYGCAFFRGQVEHPGQRLVTTDDPVYVAINLRGVYIIDEDDFVLLLGLPYKLLCWEQAKPVNESPESLPFLVLQFPDAASTDQTPLTCLLQIFSKQTPLMDKLIEACIDLRKAGRTAIDPSVDRNIIDGQGDVAKQFQRLALRTFNANRQVIKSTVRKPKNNAV